MSLIGYRDLETLRARLLPADMGEESDYEADITAIGLAVAAEFDRYTGRSLRRTVGARMETLADNPSVVLTCYPVESITSVTLVSSGTSQVVTQSVTGLHKSAGILHFGSALGDRLSTLEIVSTGGFWCQDGDEDELPEGATALPDDLLQAWYRQCRAVCDAEGIFRQKGATNFTDKDKREPALRVDTLDLIPAVKRTLQLYLRMG